MHDYKTGVPSWHRNERFIEEKGHATDLIANEAVRIIESRHDQPFFLYVTFSVPHHPLDEPPEWTERYEGRIPEPSRRWFAASVTHMDHGIGRIVEAVDRQGLRQNTLIVFSSDNGGQRGWSSATEHQGRYRTRPHTLLGDNRPLRGAKGEVYEGGIRVPTLANWPGVLRPGELDVPVHIVDWMPTLCALTGCLPERNLAWDGSDIWPALRRDAGAGGSRSFYWKTQNSSAVRRGDWKLIVPTGGRAAQIYDVTSDPYETKDLAGRHPTLVVELQALLKEYSAKDR